MTPSADDLKSLERIDKVMEERKKINFATEAGDKKEKNCINKKKMPKYKEMLQRKGHEMKVSPASDNTRFIMERSITHRIYNPKSNKVETVAKEQIEKKNTETYLVGHCLPCQKIEIRNGGDVVYQ